MKGHKLYNVFFPVWLLFLFPPIIIVALIVNFMIDSIVVKLTLKKLRVEEENLIYRRTTFKTWIFGFVSDIGGALILFLCLLVDATVEWFYPIQDALVFNPFHHPVALFIVCVAIFVAAIFIYLLNLYTFKNTGLTEGQRKKVAFNLAIFTAPYFFLLPLSLFI